MSKILDYNNTGYDRSTRDNYSTPKLLYDLFINNGYFDPCPYDENYIVNGLTISWQKKCFVNPPFSNIKGFVQKAIDELNFGITKNVWFLVPLNCDTKWFSLLFHYIRRIIFVNGRIKFNDLKKGIPTSMALIEITKDSYSPFDIQFKVPCFCYHERDLVSEMGVLLKYDKYDY